MAFKGYGVGHVNGKVIFVPHTVTGDEVWVKITEEKRRYSIGRLAQIVQPSLLRGDPPCPYFGVCGGCQWQHIAYIAHGELKIKILSETLKRLGNLETIPSFGVALASKPYGYRVRVQLKGGGESLGFFQERSHDIVNIHHCPIAHPLINQIILLLRKECPSFSRMKEIEINVSPEEGRGVLVLHPLSSHQGLEPFVKELLQTHPILKGAAVLKKEGELLFGDPHLNFTIPLDPNRGITNLRLRTSPESFFQVNLELNQALIQTALHFSEVKEDERVLDLYAGIGNLTLPLANGAKEVLGIEENKMAVEDALFNAEKNGIKNCNFILGRVEDILQRWERERPDLIVLDPPRMGCKKILDQIVRLKPKKIVYVSCEPTTFARDVRFFSEMGYPLQKLTLIDMFPQTYHMEVIGLLTH